MKELNVLSEQILKRTKEAGQKKLANKEQELAQKIEENRVRFVEQQKARKATIKTKSENDYERQVQSLANERRNRILVEKQTIMNEVFQNSIAKMTAWDSVTFQSFVEKVLNQFNTNSLHLIIGEKSASYFTDSFKETLKKKYPHLIIENRTASNKAGFIVEQGGIDYNFFFDQIVAEIKKDFSPKLASLAFEKNE
ncbi:V-type ATP synthase subunit E [Jeotgalibaca ciconiae]|uniref:V-type ATP synthase subunit E n=1 Tax=Jeotgalibaca ciconiae TaxID=2496265 RepID=A0A3Q9BLS0_9LACT|nr:hypothetical protein [Jeotgalibaca ciconiae]AZP05193.1 hypothetical protein EJN90_11380 [Jeotgalibaca ciconiae]